MSALRYYLPEIREVVSFLKTLTDVPFVVGGPGYSIFPVEALQYLGIEFGLQGEGEIACVQLARALDEGSSYESYCRACLPGKRQLQKQSAGTDNGRGSNAGRQPLICLITKSISRKRATSACRPNGAALLNVFTASTRASTAKPTA